MSAIRPPASLCNLLLIVAALACPCLALTQTACLHAPAAAPQDTALQRHVQATVEGQPPAEHSSVALYAVDLAGGRSVGIDPDLPVQTASVIKLAILYEAMTRVRDGDARWDEPIVLRPQDRVGGSGLLHLLDAPLTLTLKDVLTLMVVVSDNTATNLAIDRLGLDRIDARMQSIGLRNTVLYKKVFQPSTTPMPADQPRFGLGKSTPREMAILMDRIATCWLPLPPPSSQAHGTATTADASVCAVALEMLKDQFYRETIPRYLETPGLGIHGTAIASKTGSLDAVRNDVAVVATPHGPLVLAIFTYANTDHGWTVDNAAERLIARLGEQIVRAWSPPGPDGVLLDGRSLVPGLGLPACDAR